MRNVAWRFPLSAPSALRLLRMIFSENRLPLFRIMLEYQIAIAVGAQRPAGRHHDGRAVFLDDRGAGDVLMERELYAIEQRHVDPAGRAPIDLAPAERHGVAVDAFDRLDLRPALPADGAHPQIHQLHVLLAAIIEAEGTVMNVVEFLPHEIQHRRASEAFGNLDMHLVAFAEIAHVSDELDGDRFF